MVITTSGSIASFKTPVKQPLKSLKVYFSPIQNGSGDPSPTNVRPITGRTGLEVTRCGKNLFHYDESKVVTMKNPSGSDRKTFPLPFLFNQKSVAFSAEAIDENDWADANVNIFVYNDKNNSNHIWSFFGPDSGPAYREKIIDLTNSNGSYASLMNTSNSISTFTSKIKKYNIQIELGSKGTTYEPYSGTTIPVDWTSEAGTLYGGYVDLISGELVATHKVATYTGASTETWEKDSSLDRFIIGLSDVEITAYATRMPVISNIGLFRSTEGQNYTVFAYQYSSSNSKILYYYPPSSAATDVSSFRQWLSEHNLQVCYKLATPIVYQLSPIQLETLIGRNNIFSDADSVEAVYDLYETAEMKNIRKHIMMQPKRIQVLWNNIVPPMSTTDYRAYSDTRTTLENTEEAGTVKQTWIIKANGYSASTRTIQNTTVQMDHKYYFSYMIKPSWDGSTFGVECFGGSIFRGGVTNSNEWTRISATSYGIKNGYGLAYMGNLRSGTSVIIPDESYVLLKSPIYVDLTLMFGEGNEPDLNEFEALCATNGLDLTQSYAQDLVGTSKWWILKPVIEHSFDGIRVMTNNAFLLGGSGYRSNENLGSNNDYFVTEYFDTGDANEKSYTFTYIPKPSADKDAYARWYNALTQNDGSNAYWGITTDNSSATTRTVSAVGRYVIFSMHKEFAPYAYCYDNTNQRYVFKGSKVT